MSALRYLHNVGFSHNDVAWRNILSTSFHELRTAATFILIDFDRSSKFGGESAHDPSLFPRRMPGVSRLCAATDFMMVATLFDSCTAMPLSADARAFEHALRSVTADSAICADDLIGHAWFHDITLPALVV